MQPLTNSQATGTLEDIGGRDHAATSEYRIYGPPGTGKTTSLGRQVARAVAKFGPSAVLVTSFSRTAAAEIAGRNLPIDADRIGTLHSHCYHALGAPEIAEANVEEWNRDNPHLAITPVKKHGKLEGEESVDDEGPTTEKSGDALLQQLSRLRGLMHSCRFWPLTVQEFARKWSEYKRENGLLDFTDLIETCYRDVYAAPRNPSVIFADEAQDLNRMQLSLIRKWGERAEYFIVCGDEDQTIYSFSGASPDAMLDPDIPDDHKIILNQSYRVPRAVHRLANKLIHQVTRRQEKEYLPREEEGAVVKLTTGTYQAPEYFILDSARRHLDRGQSVMFLAACSYMLRPVIAVLRKHGVPFHNPYRRSNGFWNPLRLGKRGSTASRILSLLVAHPDYGEGHRPWVHGDLVMWAEWLQSKGILKHGAKKRLATFSLDDEVGYERLEQIFEAGALEAMLGAYGQGAMALLDWWRANVASDVQRRVEFPCEVARQHGPRAFLDPPRVVVGTIHSVKGGEADVVYLFPDLSQAGDAQYARGGVARDAVIRVFYVGATRARHTLYICQRATGMAVSL